MAADSAWPAARTAFWLTVVQKPMLSFLHGPEQDAQDEECTISYKLISTSPTKAIQIKLCARKALVSFAQAHSQGALLG